MNSSWSREILAMFRKEARAELRTRTGLITSGIFAFATVVTISMAYFNRNANSRDLKEVSASLILTVLLFSSLLSLPRSFLAEEEQGTSDLLRLVARPHSVYWGKLIFNMIQSTLTAFFVAVLFIGITGTEVPMPGLFATMLFGTVLSLISAVTLCGAIAAQAANRAALAGTIGIPLLLPVLQLGVGGLRASFGIGFPAAGYQAAVGILGYATITIVTGPYIFAAIWKK